MQVTRRQMTGALAALPLLPMLGACGARRGDALTIWAMGNEGANLPALLKGLTLPAGMPPIEVQPLPWTAAHEKLLTGFAGGSLPAIGQVGNSWIAEMAAIGAIAPVPASAGALLGDQFAAVIDTNRIAGRTWGFPGMSTRGCNSIARTCSRARASAHRRPTGRGGRPRSTR